MNLSRVILMYQKMVPYFKGMLTESPIIPGSGAFGSGAFGAGAGAGAGAVDAR